MAKDFRGLQSANGAFALSPVALSCWNGGRPFPRGCSHPALTIAERRRTIQEVIGADCNRDPFRTNTNMETATISIEVDADAARAFREAPAQERRKLEILLSLRLRELTTGPTRALKEIMDEICKESEARGLTPEILEKLLHDE